MFHMNHEVKHEETMRMAQVPQLQGFYQYAA